MIWKGTFERERERERELTDYYVSFFEMKDNIQYCILFCTCVY